VNKQKIAVIAVPVNTWALDYSGISKSISPNPIESGIHFLGPGHSLIEFKKEINILTFNSGSGNGAIQARSSEGLTVTFDAKIQYLLDKATLYSLYKRYGPDYQSPCSRYAIDTINDAALKFNAKQFFKGISVI